MAFDLIGLLTTPVALRGPESRTDQTRWEQGLDSGQTFQPTPTMADIPSSNFQEVAENVYAAHGITHAAVKMYADTIASLPLKLYEGDPEGDREEVRSHKLIDLLRRPCPQMDWTELIHWEVTSLLMGGEAIIEKIYNVTGSRIVRLQTMRPDRFGPIVNEKDGLVGYQYLVGDRGYGYDVNEIVFYKLTHPTNEWRGLSPISALRLSIESDMDAARFNRNFLRNGSLPGGVLQTDQDLLPSERKEMRREWESVHRGVNKSGRVAVLDKGLSYNGTSLSMRDSQWLEGRQNDTELILAGFHMPPSILGMDRSTNRSTGETNWKTWMKGPVRALCRRFEFRLTEEIAKEFDSAFFLEFNMDDIIRPEFGELTDGGSKAWWITVDEKRRWHNLPKIEGGDKLYVPVNMAAGGTPQNEINPVPVGGDPAPEEPEGEGAKARMRPFGR
jgi:HK97 family phage portal protein